MKTENMKIRENRPEEGGSDRICALIHLDRIEQNMKEIAAGLPEGTAVIGGRLWSRGGGDSGGH